MFETGLLAAAIVWMLSGLWLAVSLLRIAVPRWRRSGVRQAVAAAAVFALSLAGVIVCNQFVYLDYGLTSRAGLEEAKAARIAAGAGEKAAADAKAEEARQMAAKAKAEADTRQALLDAKQAALDAEQTKKDEAAQAAKDAQGRAAALAEKCKDTMLAFVMSQTFVKRQLKAPSTAEFPWITDDQVAISTRPGCVFHVTAWVDAQNGFGAQIRSRYVVDLKYLNDEAGSWRLIDIRIQ